MNGRSKLRRQGGGLGEALAGRAVPACGFGADLLRLAAIVEGGES